MKQFLQTALFWTLILSACTAGGLPPEPPSTLPVEAPSAVHTVIFTEESPTVEPPPNTDAPPATTVPTLTPLPSDTPTLEYYSRNCGYQWAYKDMPELSSDFLQSIQTLQPGAQANAFAFGEDCVYEDGSRIFIPMETDFNVTMQASDLTDQAALGELIVKVMQIIENIPPEQIIGPRPGRVSIMFESNEERQGVGFYIDRYQALETGLSYAEIYQALQASQ